MTDPEVGRYALRTFGLELVDTERFHPYYEYPNIILGAIGNRHCPGAWRDGTCTAQCLRGDYGFGVWEARRGRAVLPAPPGHAAPHKACSCGIYGSLSFNDLAYQYLYESSRITAVIAPEGATIIGTRGLRTQYARVVAWVGQGIYASVAEEQFKDADRFSRLAEMLVAYHMPGYLNRIKSGGAWWA